MLRISGEVFVRKVAIENRRRQRVHFFHYGENVLENLLRRWSRPVPFYFELLPAILRDVGMTVTDGEMQNPRGLGRWSQRAGCSCGCSPAIVLNRADRYDLFVTVDLKVTPAADNADITSV